MTETIEYKGRHHDLIKSRIPSVFTKMTLQRGDALKNAPLRLEPWIKTASRSHHELLVATNTEAWNAQNKVDQILTKLKDVYSFAEPLLKAKLLEQYDVDVDVKNTCLKLYVPKETPWYVIHVLKGQSHKNSFVTGCRTAQLCK